MTAIVVLCGGLGTRMRSLFPDLPKPLIPSGKGTVLRDVVRQFVRMGYRHFYFLAGYKAPLVSAEIETISAEFRLESKILVDESVSGTANAAWKLFLSASPHDFLFVNADTLLDGLVHDELEASEDTVFCLEVERGAGNILLDAKQNVVDVDQAVSNLIHLGLIYINRESSIRLSKRMAGPEAGELLLPWLLRKCSARLRGKVLANVSMIDIGTPDSYRSFINSKPDAV